MNPYEIIISPLVTEKAIDLMEKENKLCFEVRQKATKQEVKEAVEGLYKVKVLAVKTHTPLGHAKHAVVQLSDQTPASDIAAKLGII